MINGLKVCWISAGVSSFIAGYIERDSVDKYIYIDIDDQHPDSMRFIRDCEKLLGKKVEVLRSEYGSVESVARAMGYLNSPHGAPCTNVLKKRVRKQWEYEHRDYEITYVWGMDCSEKHRADRLTETMIEFHHVFPLIDRNLSKQDCHAMASALGVRRPVMYDMGYNNNNCIGCAKGGMGYWNKIRVDFPEVFESRAKLERLIGASFINGVYLDELEPGRGRIQDEISMDCGIMCYLALDEQQE